VTSGVESGDRVVVNGLMRVRPGMKVAPTVTSMVSDSTASLPDSSTSVEER
jgi:hypothetical protein